MATTVDNLVEEIDQQKLVRMVFKIYNLERENTKTNKYGDKEMIERIQDIIEEEISKCY